MNHQICLYINRQHQKYRSSVVMYSINLSVYVCEKSKQIASKAIVFYFLELLFIIIFIIIIKTRHALLSFFSNTFVYMPRTMRNRENLFQSGSPNIFQNFSQISQCQRSLCSSIEGY